MSRRVGVIRLTGKTEHPKIPRMGKTNESGGHSKLILLPGTGVDRRLFKYQTEALPDSVAIDWITPLPDESFEAYASRLVDAVPALAAAKGSVVCGVSLGGVVAPHVARLVDAAACVLVATVCEPAEFPSRYYPVWLMVRVCPPALWALFFLAQATVLIMLPFSPLWRRWLDPDTLGGFAGTKTVILVRLTRMMLDWAYRHRGTGKVTPRAPGCFCVRVHGTRDFVLPIRNVKANVRIEHGGHLLTKTHPKEINAILAQALAHTAH